MKLLKLQNLKEGELYIHGELVVRQWLWSRLHEGRDVFRRKEGGYWRWADTGDYTTADSTVEDMELASKVDADRENAKPL